MCLRGVPMTVFRAVELVSYLDIGSLGTGEMAQVLRVLVIA